MSDETPTDKLDQCLADLETERQTKRDKIKDKVYAGIARAIKALADDQQCETAIVGYDTGVHESVLEEAISTLISRGYFVSQVTRAAGYDRAYAEYELQIHRLGSRSAGRETIVRRDECNLL